MEKNYISDVIRNFFRKEYSDATTGQVQEWLLEEKHQQEKTEALYEVWENTGGKPDREATEVHGKIRIELGMPSYRKQSPGFRFYAFRAASVLVILFITGVMSYLYLRSDVQEYRAEKGEIKSVSLPDGSQVWLNSGSSLSWEKRGKQRRVSLSGEGYFMVAKDNRYPFRVETPLLSVEVLGTVFNIEAYPADSKTTVTLESGAVKVDIPRDLQKSENYSLKPGEQLIYDRLSGTRISEVQATEVGKWRVGSLVFHNIRLEDIITRLERRFNVKIVIGNLENPDDHYSVKFTGEESLEQIMKVLKGIGGDFTYEIEK